jgi:hypothetical protein
MAYTLKASGLATDLLACVIVNDDGTTITDLSGSALTLGTGVAATVATGSWKGTARKYFETLANGTFGFFGVIWNTPVAVDETDGDGMACFAAFHGASANTTDTPFACIASADNEKRGFSRTVGANKGTYKSGGTVAATTTDLPTNGSTKFSFGMSYRSANSSEAFYGLESGSLASEDTEASDGGFGGARNLYQLGGSTGQGNQPAKYYIFCLFDRILTEAEMQSLHDDWFGVLIDAGAADTLMAQICL